MIFAADSVIRWKSCLTDNQTLDLIYYYWMQFFGCKFMLCCTNELKYFRLSEIKVPPEEHQLLVWSILTCWHPKMLMPVI
jgi:hypothetical protein